MHTVCTGDDTQDCNVALDGSQTCLGTTTTTVVRFLESVTKSCFETRSARLRISNDPLSNTKATRYTALKEMRIGNNKVLIVRVMLAVLNQLMSLDEITTED